MHGILQKIRSITAKYRSRICSDYDLVFDPDYYFRHNPDVKSNGSSLLRHYLECGWKEGRKPSAYFDPEYYLIHNPDVKKSGKEPLLHYLRCGWKEGRLPSGVFESSIFYDLFHNINPDDKNSNPLVRFLALKDTEQWKSNNLPLFSDSEKYILILSTEHGGTEVYARNVLINEQYKKARVLYAVYRTKKNNIRVDVINNGVYAETVEYWETAHFLYALFKSNISQIIVNNLVAWESTKDILDFIAVYKKSHIECFVEVKGHDHYSLCPSYTLLDNTGKICSLKNNEDACRKCIATSTMPVFRDLETSQGFSVSAWRKMWGDFFANTVDLMNVFSPSFEKTVTKTYSALKGKISVTPHVIHPFSMCRVAIIGHLSYEKGSEIVLWLLRYLEENKVEDMKIFLFGENTADIHSPYLFEKGSYIRGELPDLLLDHKIDVVLIPSICPETFCYTAGEALTLGYHVACFDVGGQADQIKNSSKGVLLTDTEPSLIYETLRHFAKTLPAEEE